MDTYGVPRGYRGDRFNSTSYRYGALQGMRPEELFRDGPHRHSLYGFVRRNAKGNGAEKDIVVNLSFRVRTPEGIFVCARVAINN